MPMEMMMNDSCLIADASQMSYIHDFMPFLSPQRVCPRAGTWATVRIKRHVVFTQRKKLRREDFTHRSLCTERDLHRADFTRTLLHTDAFTYRSFYFLHRKAFSKEALPHEAFTQSSFTHRRFFTKKFLHPGTLMRRCPSFYTQELLHTH